MFKKYAYKYSNAHNKNYDAYLKLLAISTWLSEMTLKSKGRLLLSNAVR